MGRELVIKFFNMIESFYNKYWLIYLEKHEVFMIKEYDRMSV
jgi:hypothetical protein